MKVFNYRLSDIIIFIYIILIPFQFIIFANVQLLNKIRLTEIVFLFLFIVFLFHNKKNRFLENLLKKINSVRELMI